MGFLLLIMVALLATIAFICFAHQSARTPRPVKPRRRYYLESSSSKERLLLWSPVLCAAAALIVFSVPPLDELASPALAVFRDRICSYSLPTIWCWKMLRPLPWLVVIHAALYLWFLGMSTYLVFSIMTRRIPKPRRYVEGSFPLGLGLTCAGFWLFVVAGGQFLVPPKLSLVFPSAGLIFSVAYFCGALSALRTFAIVLKYRHLPTSA